MNCGTGYFIRCLGARSFPTADEEERRAGVVPHRDRLDSLASDDVEQDQRCAGRLLAPRCEREHVARLREFRWREHRLAHLRARPHGADLLSGLSRGDLRKTLRIDMPHVILS